LRENPPVHARLAGIAAFLEDTRTRVVTAAQALTPENSARRPAPGAWSADEILTHLSLVEPGVAKRIVKSVGRAREAGLGREASVASVLHLLDERRIETTEVKQVAPEFVEPRAVLPQAEALEALARSRAELNAALAAVDGWALAEVVAPHPRLGPLNMYEWLIFLGQHERRHLAQLERTAAAVTSEARF
jgi:uncharacterized damage-inducible protein DinB